MAKFVIWGDLHAHNYVRYARTLKNGRNSRLQECLNVIAEVRGYCVKNRVKTSIFLGDLFHQRFKIDVETFNAVYEEMAKFQMAGIKLILLAGNHDFAVLNRRISSIGTYDDIAEVVLKPRILPLQDVLFYCIPFCEDGKEFRDAVNDFAVGAIDSGFLLCHQGLSEGYAQKGIQIQEKVGIKDLKTPIFECAFLGHYHLPQHVRSNIIYVGSVMQQNWGDSGQRKGFLHLNKQDGTSKEPWTITEVPTTSPKFVKIEAGKTFIKEDVEGNYVKVTSVNPLSPNEITRIEEELKEFGAASVEIDVPKKLTSKKRLDISPEMGFDTMIEKYINSGVVDTGRLDKKRLIQVGKEILNESSR